ncbi:MAG: TrmH family RNA methyltransferase [Balneolaceae bacterium]
MKKVSNNQIKLWKKLLQGKHRRREGLFIAEGERCVEQIVRHGAIEVEALVVSEGFAVPDLLKETEILEADTARFASLSDTVTPQGIIAICRIPAPSTLQQLVEAEGLVVATDAIQDPGNLGTIIRTAAWFGVRGLLLGHGTVDPFHPKVVRSTAGATGTLPICSGQLNEMLHEAAELGADITLLDGGPGSEPIAEGRPAKRRVLVVGNEANGISEEIASAHPHHVRIPGRSGHVESLNAALAAGIGMYHYTQ